MIFEDERSGLRLSAGKRRTIEQLELIEPWYSRRVKAVEHYVPVFEERYRERYPELGSEIFIECCSTPSFTFDLLEYDSLLSLGAAIWMLDEFKVNGSTKEAMALLEDCGEADIPELCDLTHSTEEIKKVLFAIKNRYECQTEARCIMPKAMQTEKEPCEGHRRFRALMKLISAEADKKAVAHFREKMFEWMDIETAFEEQYRCEEQRMEEVLDRKAKQLEAQRNSYRTIGAGFPAMRPNELTDSLSMAKPGLGMLGSADHYMEKLRQTKLLEEAEKLEDELDNLNIKYRSLRLKAPLSQCVNPYRSMAKDDTEFLRPLLSFKVEDPYELCYALLSLLDADDDLPWLYYYPIAVAGAAAARLPWSRRYYQESERKQDYRPLEDYSWYELKYQDENARLWEYGKLNQAQLLYLSSGVLMPRLCPNDSDFQDILRNSKVSKAKQPQFRMWMSVLSEAGRRDWTEESAEESMEDNDSEATIEALHRELKQLRHENERLRQNVYSAQREAREQAERCEVLVTEAERTRQELIELGDYVFNSEEGAVSESEEKTTMVFPQNTKHRTIVFGGHDSWSREIRKKLPDVRFIERDQAPSADLIRHAELVWVQPNSISHARFNAILDIVRKHDIPFHYFSYASAGKCAEQLVEIDRSIT